MKIIFLSFILCIYSTLCFGFSEPPEGVSEPKKQKWLEMKKTLEGMTDALGRPIDKGIQDMVLGLNLLGISTYQSCEGHVDEEGTASPWVYIVLKNSEPLEKLIKTTEELEAKKEITYQKVDVSTQEGKNAILALSMKFAELEVNIKREELRRTKKPRDLLDAFYGNKHIEHYQALILLDCDNAPLDMCLIKNIGHINRHVKEPEQEQKDLIIFQNEMDNFAHFLLNVYISE